MSMPADNTTAAGFPDAIDVGQYQDPAHPADGRPTPGDVATVPFASDASILASRVFVTGVSGSGKSNTVNVLCEEILRAGRPLAILDADGEYYGLREEFEALLLGEEDCDLRAGPEHGEKLAELALEQHVPLIFDLSSYLDPEDAADAVTAFLQALFAKAKTLKEPFPVFVEEAHEYIPQQGSGGELGELLTRLGKRGRKHGLGVTAVSQRPAEVDKAFITQAEAVVWHRLTWTNDTAVAGDDLGKQFEDAIPELDDGEAFLRAEWEPAVRRVQFRRQDTYDGGQTPSLDADATPELKSVDADLVDQLEDIGERQSTLQDEVERLRADRDRLQDRVDTLEAELDTRDAAQAEFQDSAKAFAGAVEDAITDIEPTGRGGEIQLEGPDELRAEVLEVVEEQAAAEVASLEAALEEREAELARKTDRIETLEATVDEQAAEIETLTATIEDLEAELDELEAVKEREAELREIYDRMGDALDESPQDDAYRERAQREAAQREAAVEAYQAILRGELPPAEADVPLPDRIAVSTPSPTTTDASAEAGSYVEYLDAAEVERRVTQASEQVRPKAKHLWDVLFVLAEIADGDHPHFSDEDGQRPTANDIIPDLDLSSESTVYAMLGALAAEDGVGLIEKRERGHRQKATYRLDVTALERFADAGDRLQRREQFRAKLSNGDG